ncbi:hypothetical protein [Synoicihabitans lomoniglobus]|uniref:Uncharacterized protein n=1 Tax=Synoicihabitans lomoniglobus TaxID=2909285 RepID=A0AAF0CPD4_9BACT|nr:hypothetical protein [Opitutaceae bacterium LMO-M01]WED64159.1 hypothetical protein PXH66_17615 [Opitutaceae bacterium LMO-M01]
MKSKICQVLNARVHPLFAVIVGLGVGFAMNAAMNSGVAFTVGGGVAIMLSLPRSRCGRDRS